MESGRQEAVIMDAYKESGANVLIFGWGLAQYTFYVPNMVSDDGLLIPVQSGLVLTLADFGILGIFLLAYLCILLIHLLNKTSIQECPLSLAMTMAAMSKFIESLFHGSLITCLLFLMIAAYTYYDVRQASWKMTE